MMLPKEAGRFIAERAKHVFISKNGINNCAKTIASAVQNGLLEMESFKQSEVLPLDKNLTLEQLVNWTFLVDSLNFSFWTRKGDPKFTVIYNNKRRSGYLGFVNALNRAIDEGKPIYDPNYYSKLTINDMKVILRSDTSSSIPLLDKRVQIMHEIGDILCKKFDGSFGTLLSKADNSAVKLVNLVVNNFPCFQDIHFYDGQEVAILKRAQILAADVSLLFHIIEGKEKFFDIDQLTMFADYRVPQALVYFGAISYSKNLLKKLNEEHLFNSGDREEVEIRGVSIHATELLVEEVRKLLAERKVNKSINSIKIDFFLWDFRVQNAQKLNSVPYHKTRCIYY